MSENADALRRGYEAFNSGDIETVLEIFNDDIRWEGPNTEGLPMSGVHEGKDAVVQALGKIGELYERFNVSPDEMVEQDETIVVLSHIDGKLRESGTELRQPGVEVWRMRGGKAHRVQSLYDTGQVLRALGR